MGAVPKAVRGQRLPLGQICSGRIQQKPAVSETAALFLFKCPSHRFANDCRVEAMEPGERWQVD